MLSFHLLTWLRRTFIVMALLTKNRFVSEKCRDPGGSLGFYCLVVPNKSALYLSVRRGSNSSSSNSSSTSNSNSCDSSSSHSSSSSSSSSSSRSRSTSNSNRISNSSSRDIREALK